MERRIDSADGSAYTREEFESYYGPMWKHQWTSAKVTRQVPLIAQLQKVANDEGKFSALCEKMTLLKNGRIHPNAFSAFFFELIGDTTDSCHLFLELMDSMPDSSLRESATTSAG